MNKRINKNIYMFCFIFLFTSLSPCRKDQFAVLYFCGPHAAKFRDVVKQSSSLPFNVSPILESFLISRRCFPAMLRAILVLKPVKGSRLGSNGPNGPSPRSATREGVVTKMAENWRVATSIPINA